MTSSIQGWDLSNNNLCCIPLNTTCTISSIECRVYTVPSKECTGTAPIPTSTCQLDDNGNPVWLENSNVTTSDIVITDNFFINGDFVLFGNLTVSDGIITIKGCPIINGTTTYML
jgi:hypothetical protein